MADAASRRAMLHEKRRQLEKLKTQRLQSNVVASDRSVELGMRCIHECTVCLSCTVLIHLWLLLYLQR